MLFTGFSKFAIVFITINQVRVHADTQRSYQYFITEKESKSFIQLNRWKRGGIDCGAEGACESNAEACTRESDREFYCRAFATKCKPWQTCYLSTPCPKHYVTGCSDDACKGRPCQYSSACIDTSDGYTCNCLPGYQGKNCETETDECDSNPCQNGATCHDHLNSFTCTCKAGYEGTFCQIDINECASDPCQNNATCFDLENEYFCGCSVGYNGSQCESEINECAGIECLNGGTCEDLIGESVCHCLPSFTGKLCQTGLDYCLSRPCLNNGSCYSNISGYFCSCVSDWEGLNCAFRDEDMNYNRTMLMANEHMHYSSCGCLFGNERRQICYPYNKGKGVGYGTLGTALGILTSILLYLLFVGIFEKGLPCFQKLYQQMPTRPKLNTAVLPPVFRKLHYRTNEDQKYEGQVAQKYMTRKQYHNRRCYACREKETQSHNHVATTRQFSENKSMRKQMKA